MEPVGEFTRLLNASAEGDRAAFDQFIPKVYSALRRIARQRLQNERSDHTLSTTALVHEAYLKLVDLDRIQYKGQAHFYAVAAQAMRNILVSYAHQRKALKRGGDQEKLPLDDVVVMSEERADDVLALDEALQRLQALDTRRHQIVECRFFAGMSIEETAAALDISSATVKRDWKLVRAWLNRELRSDIISK